MFSLNLLLILLFAICSANGAIETVKKSYDFGFNPENSFYDGYLVYKICNALDEKTMNCKFIQESYPYKDISRSCVVNIEHNLKKTDGSFVMTVVAFGKDKAVFYWAYRNHESHHDAIDIGTIDFQTCKTNHFQLPNSQWLTMFELISSRKLVSYGDNSFDIFYQDPSKHPEVGELYKIHINKNGDMVGQPKSANVEFGFYREALSVATHSPKKGYVFVRRNQLIRIKDKSIIDPTFYLLLMKPDGTQTHLAEFNIELGYSVSAGNNFITLCYKPTEISVCKCTHYNEHGDIMFTINLNDCEDIRSTASYNQLNGDALITYRTKNCNKHGKTGFGVVWIDSRGTKKGRLCTHQTETSRDIRDRDEKSYLYKDSNNTYYATTVSRSENATIVASCFTENDLLA